MMDTRGASLLMVVLSIFLVIIIFVAGYVLIQQFISKEEEVISEGEECLELQIEVVKACYDSEVKVTVRSDSSQAVDNGFLLRLIGEEDVVVPALPFIVLEDFDTIELSVPYTEDLGELERVIVIPRLEREDGSQIVCSRQSDEALFVDC